MAERTYGLANSHGCQPQPGMALMGCAGPRRCRGRAVEATASRIGSPIARARILCAAAEILIAADDLEAPGWLPTS